MRRTVVLSANTSWNLYNFRGGLIGALAERGWDVLCVAPEDDYTPRLAELGARWIGISMSQRGLGPADNARTLMRYVDVYRRERPSVALHFTIKPVMFGSIAARLLRIPTVNSITGLGNAFLRQDAVTPAITALYRVALGGAHKVFFQNPEDLELFVERGMAPRKRTALVAGSGVNLARFNPTPPPSNAAFTFLLIARLLTEKGLAEYAQAARLLRARGVDARFLLLGPGAGEDKGAVPLSQIGTWQAEGVLEYLGETADVRPAIAAADCIVLPSYREGTPRVLLEAGAMARPSVATDVAGCRQVVVEGETGLLCRAKDAVDLADKMQAMARLSVEARARMGALARRRIEQEYDLRRVVAAYLEAIEAACPPAAYGALASQPAVPMV